MKVMFYNRNKDYNEWRDNVVKIINHEKHWILIMRFQAGNQCETVWSKRKYQLVEIRE